VRGIERAESGEIEDRSEVDEKRIITLTGENRDAARGEWTAAAASASYAGVERGPMLSGGVAGRGPANRSTRCCRGRAESL
jgi:hypothetical protein